uniref:Uncharacterized protein n=1 Tax=Daphnia magna TaxID=35525 RepID=A0A0N8DLR8_9CRUS
MAIVSKKINGTKNQSSYLNKRLAERYDVPRLVTHCFCCTGSKQAIIHTQLGRENRNNVYRDSEPSTINRPA